MKYIIVICALVVCLLSSGCIDNKNSIESTWSGDFILNENDIEGSFNPDSSFFYAAPKNSSLRLGDYTDFILYHPYQKMSLYINNNSMVYNESLPSNYRITGESRGWMDGGCGGTYSINRFYSDEEIKTWYSVMKHRKEYLSANAEFGTKRIGKDCFYEQSFIYAYKTGADGKREEYISHQVTELQFITSDNEVIAVQVNALKNDYDTLDEAVRIAKIIEARL